MSEIIEPQEISVMSLDGDGTQENPYQITTVAEFRGMNDSTAYFKLMNDLDVNDSEWVTGWTEATMNFKELDGDGKSIWNINADLYGAYENEGVGVFYVSKNSTIKNLNIMNTIMVGTNVRLFKVQESGMTFNIEGCQIYLDFNTTSSSATRHSFNGVLCGYPSKMGINKCVLNLKGTTTCVLVYGDGSSDGAVTNNHIAIDIKKTNVNTNSNCLIYAGTVFSKNFIRGKLELIGSTDFRFTMGNPQQCYVACEIISSSAVRFSGQNPTSTCFYDQELAGITMTAQPNVRALTTEQCKDKDYLNSIGFVVI